MSKAYVLHLGTSYPEAAWYARRACWGPLLRVDFFEARYYSIAVREGIVFA